MTQWDRLLQGMIRSKKCLYQLLWTEINLVVFSKLEMMFLKKIAGIQWVNFGFYAYSPYVPFYTNIDDTPLNYQTASHMVTPESSAYWLYKSLQVLVEPRYHQFIYQVENFRDECQSYAVSRISATDEKAGELAGKEQTKYLTAANAETAAYITNETTKLISDLTRQALNSSKFQFERGDNL